MPQILAPTGTIDTLADLLAQLGGVASERIRFRPPTVLHAGHTLEGGVVLPGFTLSLQELFADLDRQGKG